MLQNDFVSSKYDKMTMLLKVAIYTTCKMYEASFNSYVSFW